METQALSQSLPSASRFAVAGKISRGRSVTGILIAVLVMGGLAGGGWYLAHSSAKDKGAGGFGRNGPPTSTVGVASVEKADLPVVLDALGTVTATANVMVTPQVSGKLQAILFKEGQLVRQGQVLAEIDSRPFELALQQAQGQLRRDQASLDAARVTLKRYATLLEQDSLARQDLDTQTSLVKQLEGAILTDQANEGNARLNLSYSKIVAPVAGRVGLRMVDVGNLVSANAGGVAVITAVSPIDVAFSVPQEQAAQLMSELSSRNHGAALDVAAYDRSRSRTLAKGQFLALDNQVDLQTGTVKAKARFANADSALYPNQFVNVQLVLSTIKDALVMPVAALRHSGKGDFVYVLDVSDAEHPVAALRQVTVGQATVDKVQVLKGLKIGEKVITEGADRLKDGAPVRLPDSKPAMEGNRKPGRSGKPDAARP